MAYSQIFSFFLCGYLNATSAGGAEDLEVFSVLLNKTKLSLTVSDRETHNKVRRYRTSGLLDEFSDPSLSEELRSNKQERYTDADSFN